MQDSTIKRASVSAGVAVAEDALVAAVAIGDEAARGQPTGVVRQRLDSVDLLRGLVMVIMALDHVRDYFHSDALLFDPTDLSKTNVALFFTRWVTHFCAPVFVFLAGTGAFLSASRGKTRAELSRFLLTRGLWLILLELTVVKLGWSFSFDTQFVVQVIWAIGVSMIVLALLVHLPVWAITGFGVLMIATHNLFDPVQARSLGAFSGLWATLHSRELTETYGGIHVFTMYPLVPWIGVMAVGYGFGQLYLLERERRRRLMLRLGISLTLFFICLRAINIYGDPHPWTVQNSAVYTFLSFINCEKYPPSLLFLLMTLGPAIIALALFERFNRERVTPPLLQPLVVFGRVPLFFYIIHIPLIHALAIAFAFAKYGPALGDAFKSGRPPADYGYSLFVVYLIWVGVVLALYPVCRWFANVKRRRRDAWLSYL
jgi:uncharacterized membrane protein